MILLASLETALAFGLLYFTSYFRVFDFGMSIMPEKADLKLIGLVSLLTFLMMSSGGFYNRDEKGNGNLVIFYIIFAFFLIFIGNFIFVLGYIMVVEGNFRPNFAIFVVGILLLCPLSLLIRKVFIAAADLNVFKRRILVLGGGQSAAKIEALARQRRYGHFVVIGFVTRGEKDQSNRLTPVLPGNLLWRDLALLDFVRENRIDEIVIASHERRGLPVRDLLECRLVGVRVSEFASFWERESGQVDLEALHPSWLIYSDGFKVGGLRRSAKRAFDVVFGAAILVVTLPLTIATAIAIKLDSRGPVLYRQERVGQSGRRVHVLKFRSMHVDAENDGVPRWCDTNDVRITVIGHFIRKTRIDEIPQVINVLKGEMSFVGPRPERPFFVASLRDKIPYYQERLAVKPGITGWAQINYGYGASEDDAKTKLAYDLYYVKNSSLFLDFIILLRTVGVVLSSEGAR